LEKVKNWFKTHIKIPLGVVIAICVLPVPLIALFYIFRSSLVLMDWVSIHISLPVRRFFGLLSSIYPFSVMEILGTAFVLFLIYFIIKAIVDTSRRRKKWRLLGKRLLPILVICCYLFGAFCWLWNSGYHASGFAANNGFSGGGVSREELVTVAGYFADNANELSQHVERDEEGRYISDRREMFAASTRIYWNISEEFPSLAGRVYAPKPMLYSWFMSITGYTGMYFALTGEVMINTQPPGVFMPATVAHEHAHQLGVFAEDEANFVGILACVTSEDINFEYAGYMIGLNYLLNALMFDSVWSSGPSEDWVVIMAGLSEEVVRDRQENSDFWAVQTTADTGVDFLDTFLSNVMETTNDAVNSVYDGFLKSQNQELGIKSYGACVDLLVEYFIKNISVETAE